MNALATYLKDVGKILMKNDILTIWVVEDDAFYQQMLLSYLQLLGHVPRIFATGEDCLAHIHEKPDVVILDNNLGKGLKGLDILQSIKAKKQDTRVVILSGEHKIGLVVEAYKYGTDEYMEKDSSSLLRLKLHLEKIARARALKKQKEARRHAAVLLVSVVATVLTITIFYLYKLR